MELSEIKDWFSRYQNFWGDWKRYPYNGLTQREISQLELFRDHNFQLDICALRPFYTESEINDHLVKPLTRKLTSTYPEYREWVALRCQLSLIRYTLTINIYVFSEVNAVDRISSQSLKEALFDFNCSSVQELIRRYDEQSFQREENFEKIMTLTLILERLFPKDGPPAFTVDINE